MNKTRLEAFSDGVLAIIITIMVLELRPPTLTNWHALKDLIPVFICYLLSFVCQQYLPPGPPRTMPTD